MQSKTMVLCVVGALLIAVIGGVLVWRSRVAPSGPRPGVDIPIRGM